MPNADTGGLWHVHLKDLSDALILLLSLDDSTQMTIWSFCHHNTRDNVDIATCIHMCNNLRRKIRSSGILDPRIGSWDYFRQNAGPSNSSWLNSEHSFVSYKTTQRRDWDTSRSDIASACAQIVYLIHQPMQLLQPHWKSHLVRFLIGHNFRKSRTTKEKDRL